MIRTIKWGIIGLGKIAGKFAKGLEKVENAELFAVASRDPEKAKKFANEYHVKNAYGNYAELMAHDGVDVIYIATPHSFHHPITLQCLEHGKAVLCEKPFAMNLREAEEMIKSAREKKLFLMEALWTMFLPHYRFVKKEISSGKYGKIKSLKADFGFEAPFDEEKRLFNKSLGGGSLLDIGIYPVFLAYDLLGIPENIRASAQFTDTDVDLSTDIQFNYPHEVKAKLHSSFKEKTPTTAEINLEHAKIIMNSRFHEPTSVSIISQGKSSEKVFPIDNNGYSFEAAHVGEMLRIGKMESDLMSLVKTRNLTAMLDEIRKEIDLSYD